MSNTPILILDLLFDDENLDEIAVHGVAPRQLFEVLDNHPRIARNRRDRRATHLIVGVDHGGACIAMPVEPTHDKVIWRPVTAWYCKAHEWRWLRR